MSQKRIYIAILLIILNLLSPSYVLATNTETATASPAIDPDVIKENIKKRIEQVIQEQHTQKPQKKMALLGTISSLTPNSITLETITNSVEQASTSAETIYIQMATKKQVKREDASIGDFVAAIGFMEPGVDVLDTHRLLILGAAPPTPQKTSFFGSITSIDTKKNRIELTNSSTSETKLFALSTKSQISVSKPGSITKEKITLEELNLGQQAMVIYTPAQASSSAHPISIMLVKSSDNPHGANQSP